ncbi:hypothetical protein BN940_14261 [Castellaniella defragrans 65Phen]|uniref:DUF7064 domain-containing protein n=2 Tax=Castellaniella defragrans TaxID=75697 RepID=W8X543_CASD6|nr:hypothetical protein [Castellaniella defragrans]KAB0622750.1 hypothetical protein F7Q88_02700 [Castellaniella defragrans]MBB6085233.1 hypothetical protein [Castellaniella defragrans]CDM25297.1 hypothetical protein BN940_14261 [Castellaniella defragrans 65Phen]
MNDRTPPGQTWPPVDPSHDRRHLLPAEPLARESLVFMLQLPEHDVACFVYTWVSGLGKAGSAFVVYGPAIGAPLVEIHDGIDVPASAGFDDWRVGEVHVRHGRPFETAEVRAAAAGRAALDYRFEAVHPAYAYGSHPDGCPGWVADNRIEQSGKVSGTLTLDGKSIPFETMGHRDHSWGTRNWLFSQHWKWLEAQAGPDRAVHFWQLHALGRTMLRGYVLRDGETCEVDAVDFRFEHDAQLVPTRIHVVVQDKLGRETVVTGDTFATYPFAVSPGVMMHENSMRIAIDGVPGVGHVETFWPAAYLDHVTQSDLSAGSPITRGLPDAEGLHERTHDERTQP